MYSCCSFTEPYRKANPEKLNNLGSALLIILPSLVSSLVIGSQYPDSNLTDDNRPINTGMFILLDVGSIVSPTLHGLKLAFPYMATGLMLCSLVLLTYCSCGNPGILARVKSPRTKTEGKRGATCDRGETPVGKVADPGPDPTAADPDPGNVCDGSMPVIISDPTVQGGVLRLCSTCMVP